jgi:hypothetical protein
MALLPGYRPAAYVRGGATPAVARAIQTAGGSSSALPFGYNPAAYVPGGSSPGVAAAIQAGGFGRAAPIPSMPAPAATTPGRRVSQTASQVANQQVNTILGPQLAAQQAYAKGQNTAIQQFALALMGKLQPIAGQVGADWSQSIADTGALANQAATFLQQANPTPQVEQLLQAVNAPASQQQQLAGQFGQEYGGGAAVLNYLGGAVPGSEMATDRAAAVTQAAQYPALAALRGQQDLANALFQQRTDRNQIEAQRGQLYVNALQQIHQNNAARQTAAATAAYRQAQLTQGQEKIAQAGRLGAAKLTQAGKVAGAKLAQAGKVAGIKAAETRRHDIAGEKTAAARVGATSAATAERTAHDTAQEHQAKVNEIDKVAMQNITSAIAEGFDPKTGQLTPKAQATIDRINNQAAAAKNSLAEKTRHDIAGEKAAAARTKVAQQNADTARTRARTAAAKANEPVIRGTPSTGIVQINPDGTTKVIYKPNPKVGAAAKPFHVNWRGGTIQYTPGPNGTWKKTVLNPPAGAVGGAGQGGAFSGLSKAEVIQLRSGIVNAHDGVAAVKDSSGKVTRAALPAVDYQTAIREAMKHGYSQADATAMANRVYARSERPATVKVKGRAGAPGVQATAVP